jgi:hypothetical protein
MDALSLTFVAQGDSVLAKASYHITGTADSVVLLYSAPRSATQRHARPSTQIGDSAFLLPVPPVAEGDSLPVTVSVTPYWKGKTGRAASATASYYRAPAAIIDSLRISLGPPVGIRVQPKVVTMLAGHTQLFCAYAIFVNGSVLPAANNDPSCGPTIGSAPDSNGTSVRFARWLATR